MMVIDPRRDIIIESITTSQVQILSVSLRSRLIQSDNAAKVTGTVGTGQGPGPGPD